MNVLRCILAISCMVGIVRYSHAAEDFSSILVASDGEHAWMVVPEAVDKKTSGDSTAACRLLHYTNESGPDHARVVTAFADWPVAIASSGPRIWMVFGPRDANMVDYDLFGIQLSQIPQTGYWQVLKQGYMQVFPSLSGADRLASVAVIGNDLLAAVLPNPKAKRGIRRTVTDDSGADEEGIEQVATSTRLLLMESVSWRELNPPEGFSEANDVLLGVAAGGGGSRLAIAWPAEAAGATRIAIGAVEKYSQATSPDWNVASIGIPFRELHSICSIEGGTLISYGDETASLAYLREDGSLVGLASVDVGDQPWSVTSMFDGPRLFERRADQYVVRSIQPVASGAVGEETVVAEKVGAVGWNEIPVVGMLFVFGVLMCVIVLRPFIDSAISDPSPDLSPSPLFRRVAALIIDMVPGAVIVVLVFDVSLREFLQGFVSLGAMDQQNGEYAMLVLLITGVYGIFSEVLFGISMGKIIVGNKISSLDGKSASRLQRGLRAAVKTVILIMPPLALLVLLDPLGRGLPELVSRTVVESKAGSPSAEDEPSAEPPEKS